MSNETFNLVEIILAIGAVLSPLILGYVVWKLSTYFVSKEVFSSFQAQMQAQHSENKATFTTIENDIKTLLARK